jgi:hypothetical protein
MELTYSQHEQLDSLRLKLLAVVAAVWILSGTVIVAFEVNILDMVQYLLIPFVITIISFMYFGDLAKKVIGDRP